MSLKDLKLKFKYRSSNDQIHQDFLVPCLKESIKYDRAAGYFTSDSLGLLSLGLKPFLNKKGKIRIIANPKLNEQDLQAMKLGYEAKENIVTEDIVTEALLRELDKEENHENLINLALLIYQGQLDIKIAYSQKGIYHEKYGIFTDEEGNRVYFSGSSNETVGGLLNNFEKIDVFYKEQDLERIEDAQKDFEKLWNNTTPGLTIVSIPEVVIEKIYEKSNLRNYSYLKESNKIIPREYQQEAIEKVKENNWQGILEMATGTGKTYTSLLIANEYLKEKKKLFLIIIVPFNHLIFQWKDDIKSIGFHNILVCSSDNRNWRNELHTTIRDFNTGFQEQQVVITTYNTAATKGFNDYINLIKAYGFLIADECHYFGQPSMRNSLLGNFDAKVGLSATPSRWFDDAGTSYLNNFFNGTVFKYTLKQAIENNFLTEYTYQTIITDLTEEEVEKYESFSKQITFLLLKEKKTKDQKKQLEKLLIRRSSIIKTAQDKSERLLEILSKKNLEDLSHVLVYCGEGQIEYLTKQIANIGYRTHRFDHKVPNTQRQNILTAFAEGKIQILVAVNCLDEGVDVPATKAAYFLSSTSNPRQFIQRRGRILRKSSGKNMAEIYDFVTIPSFAKTSTFDSIVRKEIPRIAEFSENAINKYESREKLDSILRQKNVDLTELLDKVSRNYYREEDIEDF